MPDTLLYKKYFDSLLDNMLEGVAIHQLVFDENNSPIDYLLLKVNKGYENILNCKKEDVEGKLGSIVYDEYPAPALDLFSEVAITKIPKKLEYYYDKMKVFFSLSIAPCNDIGFITIFSDITELIKDKEILKQKTQLYVDLFEQNKAIRLIIEPETANIIDVNNTACNFYGYSKEQFIKMNVSDINTLPLNEILNKIKIAIEIPDRDIINNITHKLSNGELRDVEVHTNIINMENKMLISATVYDITEIKKSQIALKNSEKRLLRAEIISKTGNWELYLDDGIIVASDGAKKIYGVEGDKILLNDIKNTPLPEYRKILDESLSNLIEYDEQCDIEFKIKVGSDIKDIRAIATYNKKYKIVFGVIQDITIQKRNEEELEKSNAIKSIFLSNISHELRTPMNAIIGFSDILLETNRDKDSYKFLRSINSNAKHLDELLNNILDYSKIENSEFDILYENFSINELFDELLEIFEDVNYKKNLNFVKLDFIKEEEDRKIICDYLRLKQVLFNIISNSIKFTEKGYIKVSYSIENNFILFKIEDTGIGIPEDKIQYVFDRFWQGDSSSRKKYKGTGLGLSISKSIVDLLLGKIYLESTLNKGTTFFVKIPLEEIQNVEVKNNTNIDFNGKTILIIDELPCIYSLLGIYLNSLNVNTISESSEKNAIKIYKQKNKIDLIIIDLNLPDINSIKLSKKFKKINKDCIIISMSSKEEKIEHIDYNLQKPINKEELLLLLKKIWQK